MTAKPITARIEVFRPGTFTPMQGEPITYSPADLRAIADAYDPDTAPAPVVIGHPDTDAPAFGWVDSFHYDAASERLVANLHEIEPAFAEMVKTGRFKKVSMAFFGPSQPHNPVPGTWYPKHVGFLGAAAPAVSGLKNAAFAGAAGATFTAGFGAVSETASILRALRDLFIGQFGLEDADRALPPWKIEWLEAADPQPAPAVGFASPAPAGPTAEQTAQPTEKETPVTGQTDPAFAAREADLAAREAAIAAREAAAAHDDNLAFAERLVAEGRLLPASRDQVVAILDASPSDRQVAFAEGAAAVSLGAALRQVLEAQPRVVTFGALDLPEGGQGATPAFAADGRAVDPERLALHSKALDYQRTHPGTAWIDAVRAVS